MALFHYLIRLILTVLLSIDFGFYFGVARFRCQDLNFPSSFSLDSLSSDVSSPYSSLSRLIWVFVDPG